MDELAMFSSRWELLSQPFLGVNLFTEEFLQAVSDTEGDCDESEHNHEELPNQRHYSASKDAEKQRAESLERSLVDIAEVEFNFSCCPVSVASVAVENYEECDGGDYRENSPEHEFHHSILLVIKEIAAITRRISNVSSVMSLISLPNVSRFRIIV